MSAKHLWSTGCVIQSRFCRSQGSMCWVQCVLQDAGIVASGRRSIGSMNERQNISKFASLVLHLAVGAHSILELRCRFHIGEREAFASSISSKLWSCGLRHAQVTHHNLLHIWGTKWCPSLCHVFRYFDHLLLCNDKVTIHCICGDQPFWMSWIFFLRMLSPCLFWACRVWFHRIFWIISPCSVRVVASVSWRSRFVSCGASSGWRSTRPDSWVVAYRFAMLFLLVMHGSLTFMICQSDECHISDRQVVLFNQDFVDPNVQCVGCSACCRMQESFCIWSSQHWQHERTSEHF